MVSGIEGDEIFASLGLYEPFQRIRINCGLKDSDMWCLGQPARAVQRVGGIVGGITNYNITNDYIRLVCIAVYGFKQ